MFPRLFLLFTLGPVVELALLLYFAETFGWRVTLATVVGTGLLGAWLVKREGWRAWERMQGELASGNMPGNALIDAMMVFAGGILLITPGVLSDLLGLSLAFPPTRAMIRRLVRYRFQVRGGTLSNPPRSRSNAVIRSAITLLTCGSLKAFLIRRKTPPVNANRGVRTRADDGQER